MSTIEKRDTTYKIESLNSPIGDDSRDASLGEQLPEKLYPHNPEPASSKEAVHDAPEVVEQWLYNSRRPTSPHSPYSEGETVVSGFQPLEFDEKGAPIPSHRGSEVPVAERTTCGLRRRHFIACVILVWVILVAVGLGLGLGIGLRKKHFKHDAVFTEPYCVNNPQYCIGGALGSNYYTKNGTFNGTGIAIAGESWNREERKIMTVYFQHWTGEIRWIQLTPKGEWLGGSRSEVIATDAKNATPISVVAYAVNGTAQWHLFYIDESNIVREKTNTNSTNIWQDGPLNDLNLTVYDAPSVGLQACWYGNYYGDSDASVFPTHDGDNNTIPFGADTHGMHLWYPTDERTYKQYGWYEGQEQWADQQHTWNDMNAHAGVGCYSWGPGTTTYTMMVNKENTAEIWWKDSNANLTSTSKHPVNTWENATGFGIPNVHPSSSLGYTEYFYAQKLDGTIQGHNMDWSAENTTSIRANMFTVGNARGPVPGLPGTHLSVTAVGDQSGGSSLYVFYQTRGDDLSVFVRDIKGGSWSQGELPIPDE
jgi:hypothetical protein